VASLLVFRDQDYNILGGICAVTALTVFSFYRNYLIVTFRSKNSFQSLARIQLYEAVLTVATIPLLVYMLYEGLLIRAVLVEAIILFLLYRVRPFKVSAVWDKASFKELMRTGAPIFALDYIGSTARTFDRVALLRCGGFQEVGYYALAATAYGAFSTIPMSIAQYLYPRMSYSYGRDNDPAHLWRMAWKTGAIIIVIMFPIACLGWYIIPPVVQSFFPQYVNGTDAARIMVFSAVLTGAAVGVNALWSMKAWKYMAIYQILISGLYAIAPFIGIAFCAYPVTGVAYGLLGASSVTFGLAIALTYTATHGRRPILK
jgi:O-antigen/teichoic acid export membrane protein